MSEQLGPFQGIWDAWIEVEQEIAQKPLEHFERATQIQFEELKEHLARGDREAAARELVDVVSIALNHLRNLGFTPQEIAGVAQDRADRRMKGQAKEILEKYRKTYGI
ncbi:hypothetical protein C5F59_026770 [Streptomyces sp. QL37]|uniref:hypothetical protein n=1 Tax=Streptomyces sp. QL37 TaxID=2093747 RepID=UPI000CF1D690|nr:hypothetical protein [Streptomyces sp. QL37]PPQ57269.1 hypothetical protein C5F59_11650 [Streptomyces sp. QL37]